MSINSAMLAGVSGLVANSSALAAISDNIANVNTVGYKRNVVNFANVITGTAAKGRYSAGGVQGSIGSYVSQQGLLQTSSSPTDIGISGEGFFVVTEKATDLNPSDARAFTRAGSFSVDAEGFLVNNAGFYLQGWPIDANGDVDANPADLNRLQSINVRNIGATVIPSTEVQVTANLNSDGALSPQLGAYNALTNSMSAYDIVSGTGTRPDFTVQMEMIDSLGGSHTVALSVLKSATANEWNAEIYAIPASEVVSGAGLASGQIRTGTIAFTPDGRIDLANSTLFGGSSDPTISLGASASGAPGAGAANWATNLGIDGQTIAFNLDTAGGGLSQLASVSSVKTVTNNGKGVGEVTAVEVNEEGFVSAVFDNGEVRALAQIALASFMNPDGLNAASGNIYRPSIASGDFSLKRPGDGGAGTVSSAALEASTVDLSSEFTGLITTQRAYSASSKIIMTADQMLEELLSIKR